MTDPVRQTQGTPQEQWVIRTDAGARKVVERLDALTAKVDQFNGRLKRRPTKSQVAMMILVAGSTAVGTIWKMQRDEAEKNAAAIAAHERRHEGEVMQLRTEFQNAANRTDKSVQDLANTVIRVVGRRQRSEATEASGGAP